MKKLITLIFTSLTLVSLSQNTKLSGEITNPVKDVVYARYFQPNLETRRYDLVILDSCVVKNGKFNLSFDLDSLMDLQFYDGNEQFGLSLMPNDDLNLKLNTAYFDETIRFSGIGAERNTALSLVTLIQEIENNVVSHWINDMEESDTTVIFHKIDSVKKKVLSYLSDLKLQFPVLSKTLELKEANIEQGLNSWIARSRSDSKYKRLEERTVGQKFINVEGVDLAGKKAKISDFYGKPLLIDFWATWCGPCKYEMPYLKNLEETYGEKINVLSVGVWCKEEEWKEMAKDFGFEHNIFLTKDQATELQSTYLLRFIPRYMLLDANGKIITVSAERPSAGLEDQFNEILSGK